MHWPCVKADATSFVCVTSILYSLPSDVGSTGLVSAGSELELFISVQDVTVFEADYFCHMSHTRDIPMVENPPCAVGNDNQYE